ncbi:hypothetical protein PPYR_14875, partial [Photinus pyralis]
MRNYKRKSDRQSWCEEQMLQAIQVVVGGGLGTRKASIQFGISKATLERHVKRYAMEGEAAAKK